MAPDALLMLLVTTGSPAVFGLGVVWVMRGAYALMSSGGDDSRTQEAVQTIEDGTWLPRPPAPAVRRGPPAWRRSPPA